MPLGRILLLVSLCPAMLIVITLLTCTNGVVPDVAGIASGWVVRERLVHNIPAVAVVAKVLYEVGNMVLQNFRQSLVRPRL